MSRIEAHIRKTEAVVICFDHHHILICTGVALPLPLRTYSSGKISKGRLPSPLSVTHFIRGVHKDCLRIVPGLCLICQIFQSIHKPRVVKLSWEKSSYHCIGNQEFSPIPQHVLFINTVFI